MVEFCSSIWLPGLWHCAYAGSLAWLTVTPAWNAVNFNVICHTCASPATTSQHVCCEEGVWKIIIARTLPRLSKLLQYSLRFLKNWTTCCRNSSANTKFRKPEICAATEVEKISWYQQHLQTPAIYLCLYSAKSLKSKISHITPLKAELAPKR